MVATFVQKKVIGKISPDLRMITAGIFLIQLVTCICEYGALYFRHLIYTPDPGPRDSSTGPFRFDVFPTNA
jgi:hypothetical protein